MFLKSLRLNDNPKPDQRPRNAAVILLVMALTPLFTSAGVVLINDPLVRIVSRGIGGESANSFSSITDASAELEQLLFLSRATDLSGDPADDSGFNRLWLLERATLGLQPADSPSGITPDGSTLEGSISADGSSVVFASSATNLVGNDSNSTSDVFALDVQTRTVTLLSTNRFSNPAAGPSNRPVVNADGQHVLFLSRADNLDLDSGIVRDFADLMALDRDSDTNGVLDEAGTLAPRRLLPVGAPRDGLVPFFSFDLSDSGRYVVFVSSLTGITATAPGADYNAYFHDRDTDEDNVFDEPGAVLTQLLTAPSGLPFTENVSSVQISSDGFRVVLRTRTPELTPECTDTDCGVFVLEFPAVQGVPDPTNASVLAALPGVSGTLSNDGTHLTYRTRADDDLRLRQLPAVSDESICLSETGRGGNRGCSVGIPSDDGNFVFFSSRSSNLVRRDANAENDVFLYAADGIPVPSPPLRACEDELDNDGDGDIDLADDGCFGPEDDDESVGQASLSGPVEDHTPGPGAFLTLDERGLAGRFPQLASGNGGLRQVVFQTDEFLGTSNPTPQIRLVSFDRFQRERIVLDRGYSPQVVMDSSNRWHVTHFDESGSLLYRRQDNPTPEALPDLLNPPINAGQPVPSLLTLDDQDQPLVLALREESDQLRLWRPGSSPVDISIPDTVSRIAFTQGAFGELLVVYNSRLNDMFQPINDLISIVLDSNGNLLSERRLALTDNVSGPISLSSDIYGLPHVVFRTADGALIYVTDRSGVLESISAPLGDRVTAARVVFESDGFTPRILVSSQTEEPTWRAFAVAGDELNPVTPPPIQGKVGEFAIDNPTPQTLEYVYLEPTSGNLVHGDPDAAPWLRAPFTLDPNSSVRDLIAAPNRGAGGLNTVLGFTSAFAGGAGELVVYRRSVAASAWTRESVAPAAPQDAAAFNDNGTALVHFENLTGQLRFVDLANGTPSETIVTFTDFSSFAEVDLFEIGGAKQPVVVGLLRGGDGNDQIVGYRREGPSQWTALPLTSPITAINRIAADTVKGQASSPFVWVAYSSNVQGELRLARLAPQTGVWTDAFVDDGDSPAVIGNFLSLMMTQELNPSDVPTRNIPTLAYDINSRTGLRYAFRSGTWRFWDPAIDLAPGQQLQELTHDLLNDSRIDPVLAVASSTGNVDLLSQDGDALNDDVRFTRQVVATDFENRSNLALLLNGRTYIAYDNAAGGAVASGAAAGGLATIAEPISYDEDDDELTTAQLIAGMCLAFFEAVNSAQKGMPQMSPVDDETVLGGWAQIFQRTSEGQRYIDFYRRSFPKIARLVAEDRGMRQDAIATLQNFMPGIQAMTEGRGDDVILDATMLSNALDIWQRLSDRDSGPLSAFIESELARWNNLDDFVGLTFDEWGQQIGLQVGPVGGSDVLFANSFETSAP